MDISGLALFAVLSSVGCAVDAPCSMGKCTVIVKRVQHVSIPIPMGGADQVRAFYTGVLGIPEKKVPRELDAAKLTWFAVGDDEDEIHCYVEEDYLNRSNAQHLCLEVEDIAAMRQRVMDAGVPIEETTTIAFVHGFLYGIRSAISLN